MTVRLYRGRTPTSYWYGASHRELQRNVRMIPTRRTCLWAMGGSLLLPPLTAIELFGPCAHAEEKSWRYGVSEFGQLKYPAQFAHFDYVDPQAPKLGTVRQGAFGTYDNFNIVVAGWKGDLAAGIDLIYESAVDAVAGRNFGRIWLDCRGGELSARFLFGRPFACGRKRDGTTADRSRPMTSFSPFSPSRPIVHSLRRITGTCARPKRPASAR